MTHRIASTVLALMLAGAPSLALAHGDDAARPASAQGTHDHAHDDHDHAGAVADLAGYEAELAFVDGTVVLTLRDHDTDAAVDPAGFQAMLLFVKGEERAGTLKLAPEGGALRAAGVAPDGADALVTLRTADGRTAQARFELGGHTH